VGDEEAVDHVLGPDSQPNRPVDNEMEFARHDVIGRHGISGIQPHRVVARHQFRADPAEPAVRTGVAEEPGELFGAHVDHCGVERRGAVNPPPHHAAHRNQRGQNRRRDQRMRPLQSALLRPERRAPARAISPAAYQCPAVFAHDSASRLTWSAGFNGYLTGNRERKAFSR